jgi:hypothetical protein
MAGFPNPLTTPTGFVRATRDTMRRLIERADTQDILLLNIFLEMKVANQLSADLSGVGNALETLRRDALLDILGESDAT